MSFNDIENLVENNKESIQNLQKFAQELGSKNTELIIISDYDIM